MEQRPDGQPDDESVPGSDIEPARPAAPAEQEPPQLDAEQLRQFEQFQQFQRFQEFQRLQAMQEQPGAANQPAAGLTQQLERQPERRKPKVPRWLAWLGKKLIGWLIFFILLAIAATWAYNHYFGGPDEADTTQGLAKQGGGTYHTNRILSSTPYVAVQNVYKLVADASNESAERACVRFDVDNGVDQKFARDLGYPSCREAVLAMGKDVAHVTNYSRSVYPQQYDPGATRLRIDSCDFEISDGPALGVFVLSKVEKGQWLITGHEPGPKTCPAPTTGN